MKVPYLLMPSLVMSAFVNPKIKNIPQNAKAWGVPANNDLAASKKHSDRAQASRLSYSDDGNSNEIHIYNDFDDGKQKETNSSDTGRKKRERDEVVKKEKYTPQEIFRDFTLRKWGGPGGLQDKIQKGANTDMDLKRGNTLAHLIADLPLKHMLTSTYNNSLDTLKMISQSGYNFEIKVISFF